jgi:hypothetical protein
VTHALQWNCAANTVRVTTVEEMLADNRAAYRENRQPEFVPLLIASRDECVFTAENVKQTLVQREVERSGRAVDKEMAKWTRGPGIKL